MGLFFLKMIFKKEEMNLEHADSILGQAGPVAVAHDVSLEEGAVVHQGGQVRALKQMQLAH